MAQSKKIFSFSSPFLFRRRNKRSNDCLLALDIGTEFVKAIVFKLEKNLLDDQTEGVVLGVGYQRQKPGHMQAGAVKDLEGVIETCQAAMEEAVEMSKIRPRKGVLGIAGEFIKGATNNFIFQRSQPEEEIDLAELRNILQKIQWRAFDQIRRQLAWETGRAEIEIKPMNAVVSEIRIDGYLVSNPIGFRGREIFFSIFNVYGPLVHLSALEKIASQLDLELLAVAAEPYALTRAFDVVHKGGAIFIDVGGGTTDVALVRQSRVEGIKSFALAGRTFTKRLAETLSLGFEEAEDIKVKYSQQLVSRSVQRKIREILRKDINTWINGIELILEEFSEGISDNLNEDSISKRKMEFFPPLVLLCGGGSLLSGLKDALKKESKAREWEKKFPFRQPPFVNFVHLPFMSRLNDQTGKLKGIENVTPLALAGLTSEMATEEQQDLSCVLRQVIRLMR